MFDGLDRNIPKGSKTLPANCLAHSRRRFRAVLESFPDEVCHVIDVLREVYRIDARAYEEGLDPKMRLELHQRESRPLMDDLERWLREQIEEKKVEPNSTLGEVLSYVLKRWKEMTVFLRQPGAPLDNHLCEQVLKKAIFHRKNALFFKSENGARVGDLFMSLIHRCELLCVNPFDYLNELQRNAAAVADSPSKWLPWNCRATIASRQ